MTDSISSSSRAGAAWRAAFTIQLAGRHCWRQREKKHSQFARMPEPLALGTWFDERNQMKDSIWESALRFCGQFIRLHLANWFSSNVLSMVDQQGGWSSKDGFQCELC